jgi:trans-AT polyketide synthase/acyltransferase/oxidoreductase domain-containing protein
MPDKNSNGGIETIRAIVFPGQGSQFKGMGKALFPRFRELAQSASDVLGYCVETLCLEDPDMRLNHTAYTQPAVYVVNAMNYCDWCSRYSDDGYTRFMAGHSLGEFNALLAAGAIDFVTGLKLVQKRGQLMGEVKNGGMAAILDGSEAQIEKALQNSGIRNLELANYNSPRQFVVAGPRADIAAAQKVFEAQGMRFVPLNVSAPFHSSFMRPVQEVFTRFIDGFEFRDPTVTVISNWSGRPYEKGVVAPTLASQIANPVRWTKGIQYMLGQGPVEFVEMGSVILTKMITEIRTSVDFLQPNQLMVSETTKIQPCEEKAAQVQVPLPAPSPSTSEATAPLFKQELPVADDSPFRPDRLGSPLFRRRFGTRLAYVAGSMYRGIGSPELVVRMGRAGMIGFFGTGGLPIADVDAGLEYINARLTDGQSYGVNLLANYLEPEQEFEMIELFEKHKVRRVEAAAFMRITPALVLFRLRGLRKVQDKVVCDNHILAKVSRAEVAENFMAPPPGTIVLKLLEEKKITREQADLAARIPMAHDICVEADSGGHTDGGISTVIFPALLKVKQKIEKQYNYDEPMCIGLAGGIGSGEAAAAAFMMGADFVLTGSVNQCTVEAGIGDEAKSLLQEMAVQDTDYVPAGDMFEMGAQVQVLTRSLFFPGRAKKLYSIYQQYGALDEIPDKTKRTIENGYFKRSFEIVWADVKAYFESTGRLSYLRRAEQDPKFKMALLFRWYFHYSSQLAMRNDVSDRANFQIHTGPALGAFNENVKGTSMENWTARHVDVIADMIMEGAARTLQNSFARLAGAGE